MWKAGLVALTVLAACAAPQTGFNRVGQGVTVQQRIASAAGLEVGSATSSADRQGFNEARDVGFAATSVMNGGGLGLVGGVAGALATPTKLELLPILILETNSEAEVLQMEATVEKIAAPMYGLSQDDFAVKFIRQGTADGVGVYAAEFYGGKSTTPQMLRSIADRYPSLSAYVPPLRVNGQWQRPYLHRNGQNLPL